MNWPIPRGRISHPLFLEINDLFHALIYPSENNLVVKEYQKTLGYYLQSHDPILFPFARTGFYAILKSLNLPKGSKILMPTITIKPMLDIVLNLGIEPIFVDVDIDTACWDLNSLKDALEQKPSVGLLTYLFGVVPNLAEILPVLKEKKIVVIEDFSQAFGAKFQDKFLGTHGDFGICSTSSTKTFDTYGGAIVMVNDRNYLELIEYHKNNLQEPQKSTLIKKIIKNIILNFASNKLIFCILTFPSIKITNARKNDLVGKFTGARSLSPVQSLPEKWFEAPCAFQAKIGMRELKKQASKDLKRIEIANRYTRELSLLGPRGSDTNISIYWQYINIDNQPVEFRKYLNKNRIDCATTSLVNLTRLKEYGFVQNLPNTQVIYDKGVYLPCYHQLKYRQQSHVITSVKEFYENQ
jgi:perosamine synthetase